LSQSQKPDRVLVTRRLKERSTVTAENSWRRSWSEYRSVRNEERRERNTNARTKMLLSTSGYQKVSCKEECSPTFHFCLLAVSSWLQTSRTDRIWLSSREWERERKRERELDLHSQPRLLNLRCLFAATEMVT